MSDGSKSGLSQIAADINEAVVKPVSDEVGKALESATGSLTGNFPTTQTLSPADKQKKQAEETQRKMIAIQTIQKWNQKLQEDLQKVRSQNRQKEESRLQEEKKEEQVKQYKVEEKKQQQNAALAAKNTAEKRKGVGG